MRSVPGGPDALSDAQAADALVMQRPMRWWAPAMWLYLLSMTLAAFGTWIWVDAESDLHVASDTRLSTATGVITSVDNRSHAHASRRGYLSVRYEFTFGSLTYVGSRVGPFDSVTPASTHAIREHLKPGATVPIKYLQTNLSKNFIDVAAWTNLAEEEIATRQSRLVGIALVVAAVPAFVAAAWTFITARIKEGENRNTYQGI